MKLHAALCFLVFAGCATVPSGAALSDGGGGPVGSTLEQAAPVRLQTPAGTFLVSPQHADDFAKALAGEATPTPFYAGADHP
ncbi:hypothetical protein [Hyalangium rubrum]|uniref:Lipoprotein n=1 Tax=Hyalangium rubrum TaxID=3103134 RepID=A0ABU5H9W8_9BACT|nr:hypothetical protein [Hyalangium sp. s54d21]MDY7228910.1 hypothetical protein [Hyalangium sp. s54d21]